jgi:hypothetical protein
MLFYLFLDIIATQTETFVISGHTFLYPLVEEVFRHRSDPMLHGYIHLIIAAESFCRYKFILSGKKANLLFS